MSRNLFKLWARPKQPPQPSFYLQDSAIDSGSTLASFSSQAEIKPVQMPRSVSRCLPHSPKHPRVKHAKIPHKHIKDKGDINILLEDDASESYGDLVDDMVRFRKNPVQFLENLRKYYRGEGFRGFNEYIGMREYYPTFREDLLDVIISRPLLQQTVQTIVDERMELEKNWSYTPQQRAERRATLVAWVEGQVRSIGYECMPKLQRRGAARFEYYMVAQAFSRCYNQGVHIPEDDIRRVRAKAKELEKKQQSLLLFPCHKSHVDYISLVFAFYRVGLSLPVTVAGENLNIPIVGDLLKEVGAVYIRRTNWAEDPLYGAFFQCFVEALLRQGGNFQCFVEGTRSRTGKLLPPKFGILKFVLQAILSGAVADAWVLPVSTQYDKVFEGDQYATELMGREKKAESLKGFLESVSIVSLRLGRVDIRFGEIWSVRGWVVEQLQSEHLRLGLKEPLQLDALQLSSSTKVYLLRSLGYKILSDVNKASAIMPSALIGSCLLTTPNRGTSRDELIARVQWLIGLIVEAGGQVGALSKPPAELTAQDIGLVVDNAIQVLGSGMVTRESKTLLEDVYFGKDEFKLSYYRNQVVHLFVSEAIVCIALYTINRRSFGEPIRRADLEKKVHFLSALLSSEFIFRPDGLELNLSRTLATLQRQDVLRLERAADGSSGSDTSEIILNLKSLTRGMPPYFDFYCYLVWPFIDGYWCTALSLFSLVPNSQITEKDFLNMAQSVARTLYAEGEITHSEALNKEMIRFALQKYESMGIVQRSKAARGSSLAVTAAWQPSYDSAGALELRGPLFELSEEIARSRNKKLKYGVLQSVSERVLGAIQPVAAGLCTPRM